MKNSRLLGYLFAGPAMLHLVVFAAIPIGYALWLSLFKWRILQDELTFVGFGNYSRVFSDEGFWNSALNTLSYTAFSVPIGIAVALLVALMLAQRLKMLPVLRTIYYLPAICSQVAIAMMWIYIYLPKNGVINMAAGAMGFADETDFLNEPGLAMAGLVFMSIWVGLGPKMILYLAGIMNIPQELNEAAELDGAGPWRRFLKVTLPLLAPTTLFVLVTSTIASMQVFAPVYMMTKGGPDGTTDMVGYHIYVEAWEKLNFGLAAAQSVLLFVVILLLSLVQLRMMRSSVEGWSAA